MKKIVEGRLASPGEVLAPVRIIDRTAYSDNDFSHIQKGEIIVTDMTTPDMMEGLVKAGGIITDEGGILCHAAIVSRQLHIPCVVGTKEATKNFRTGDTAYINNTKFVHSLEYVALLSSLCSQPEVGSKAANLGSIIGMFKVPKGFCVKRNAYDEHVALIPADKQAEKPWLLRELITDHPLNPVVAGEIDMSYRLLFGDKKSAVRSSCTLEDLANAPFAGQYDTFLDVVPGNVGQMVKKCWSSYYSDRAVEYRKAISCGNGGMAVLIQEMVYPTKAGVMFTADPVAKNNDVVVVEAVKGLADKMVSGCCTPTTYHVDRKTKAINVTGENILSTEELELLAGCGEKLESYFKCAQDVEWALAPDLYVLQSRPAT